MCDPTVPVCSPFGSHDLKIQQKAQRHDPSYYIHFPYLCISDDKKRFLNSTFQRGTWRIVRCDCWQSCGNDSIELGVRYVDVEVKERLMYFGCWVASLRIRYVVLDPAPARKKGSLLYFALRSGTARRRTDLHVNDIPRPTLTIVASPQVYSLAIQPVI